MSDINRAVWALRDACDSLYGVVNLSGLPEVIKEKIFWAHQDLSRLHQEAARAEGEAS